jgi:hypothetical protein
MGFGKDFLGQLGLGCCLRWMIGVWLGLIFTVGSCADSNRDLSTPSSDPSDLRGPSSSSGRSDHSQGAGLLPGQRCDLRELYRIRDMDFVFIELEKKRIENTVLFCAQTHNYCMNQNGCFLYNENALSIVFWPLLYDIHFLKNSRLGVGVRCVKNQCQRAS